MSNKSILVLTSLLVAAAFALTNCRQQSTSEPTSANHNALDAVKRGEYLVNALGCDDCHTPKNMTPQGPVPDPARRFMGHPADEPFNTVGLKALIDERHVAVFSPGMTAAAGPWGVSYGANITPDESGIGNWTEAQFFKAIREGKSKGMDGARPLLPPMPWPSYSKLTDEDLRAIFAYLKSVKPINNVVPAPNQL